MKCTLDEFRKEIEAIRKKTKLRHKGKKVFPDGPVCMEAYYNASPRIVWMLKEMPDFCKDASGNDISGLNAALVDQKVADKEDFGPTWKMIGLASEGIFSGDNWQDLSTIYNGSAESLKKIAIVNAKKELGEFSSKNADILECYQKDSDLTIEMLEVLEPEIIIFGYPAALEKIIDKVSDALKNTATNWKQHKGRPYSECDGRKYIWMQHPSYPKGDAKQGDYFDQLMEIIRNQNS